MSVGHNAPATPETQAEGIPATTLNKRHAFPARELPETTFGILRHCLIAIRHPVVSRTARHYGRSTFRA